MSPQDPADDETPAAKNRTRSVRPSSVPRPGSQPAPALDEKEARRRLRNGLISLALLMALTVGLLTSAPGLHSVAHIITHMGVGWLLIGIGLEALSCVSYALAFLQVFNRSPLRFGARVALSELAFGAAVPVGGAGSVAVGAWLLIERGRDPKIVAERSAVLFLLTSAINVLTLTTIGLGLFVGIVPGSRNPLLSIVPAAVGAATLAFFVALPAITQRLAALRSPGTLQTVLTSTASSVRATRSLLLSRDWRIVGAIGYLWFDIGVLVVCLVALRHAPPLASVVLAYQIAYVSSLIPIPGGIGVVDGSFVAMLALYGIGVSHAVAATVVYRAISLLVPAIWGTATFLLLRHTRDQPLTLRPEPPRELG